MATIKRFEELECWQSGRRLKRQVYLLTKNPAFARDLPLVSQIGRAASSVTANIVEGFERNGNREFVHFLSISKGSCGEIKDQLYTALDESYISRLEFDECYTMAEATGNLVGGFMKYLEHSALHGAKLLRRSRTPVTRNPEL